MAELKKQETKPESKSEYEAPKGQSAQLSISCAGESMAYKAESKWIVLRKAEKPTAEVFCTTYTREGENDRPVTFVFNGGPGASSVYLHMGALGPRRVDLSETGLPKASPHKLADNEETWLTFTDLVFVDPVGTGLSRMIEKDTSKEDSKQASKEGESQKKPSEYWKMKRDLESIGEFVRTWLSQHHRWESPVFIAGESYGGYRVGKLAKVLQKDYGVGLAGAIMISPALEFSLLDATDYNVLPYVDTFPTMAAAAFVHGKSRKAKKQESMDDFIQRARAFALNELLPVLASGEMASESKRTQVFNSAADFIGMPRPVVLRKNGRISITYFVKNLLREDGKTLGLYDASVAVSDPFQDRDELDSPDPTLHILERVFASAINTQLRREIGLVTDRDYELLSHEVNTSWKNDEQTHSLQSQFGAVDDLRYGMSLNEHMQVFLTHGLFDLVTAFTSSDRLLALMKLTPEQKERLTVHHYPGGHMFYTWKASREAFTRDIKAFYRRAGELAD
ncbi:peptidase S10 [Puniceicoccales bacterium CK1056]|uniref:Peptidase S10 n=1 Tax=Oceanipulchritudo coccoides TaxID=2706888 RepID=A0A6B2M3C3_9BACT|nr:peptidase S10 [Oceanipulchritudo coccoides]NDV62906.1 peptidase S10 [Oceanipulchritudo coccoides]